MPTPSVQLDPLDSPHPVPWNWVTATLATKDSIQAPRLYYYRSHSLISVDGQYAAYSRIQMQVDPEFSRSRVASVLFLENLKTGELQAITPTSPLAENPFKANAQVGVPGSISIVIPISWSQDSNCLLAREFESIFCTDLASDYALIWDRQLNRTSTVAPARISYTNAVLLGWSRTYPDRALFRAGHLGDNPWPLWVVDRSSQTVAVAGDGPQVFGSVVNSIWTGPQMQR